MQNSTTEYACKTPVCELGAMVKRRDIPGPLSPTMSVVTQYGRMLIALAAPTTHLYRMLPLTM